jgi:branched-chain amino acid transport system substrate-binding protein
MTPPRCTTLVGLLTVIATVLSACSAADGDDAPVRKIAFFQDLSIPDHVDLVSPSFLAFDTVLRRRLGDRELTAEIVQFDTRGDAPAAIEMAERVAEDPSFVLAVAAPFWHEPVEVGRILAEAGVPTMSLSPVSASPWDSTTPPPGSAADLWRRFVPDRAAEAALVADLAGRRSAIGEAQPVCLVRDGSRYGGGLVEQVAAGLGEEWPSTPIDGSDPLVAAAAVDRAGCRVVVWGGFSPGARDLARAMRAAGSARGRPIDLAGDALKTTIPPTSPAGDGVVVGSVACSCVDVSIDIGLPSRRFVNAYQSEHGLAPGVYAAEAWDAGRLAGDWLAAGASDRDAVAASLALLSTFDGVARAYAFDEAGELTGAEPGLYLAAGTRWLPLPS